MSISFFKKEYLSTSPSQTKKLGRSFAKGILKNLPREKALILALSGDLGGGKTTFLQGFAKGLEIKSKITSPTFVIIKRFQVSPKHPGLFGKRAGATAQAGYRFQYFYHIDCYRIKKPKEILTLGFKEIITDPKNIVAIEWAEKIKKILPKETLWLKFEFKSKNKRRITFKSLN
ncbi:MAG: tRNA (adenosine(37)-N6)-threonylcarbamoyltransferase complex ATPase subunit type 1 TsaE [Patescibacteria group bacterium]|nr:tRNA (adenosine(37)-N6)-threonylcarbamoyltransferase complex ATPase subunit type 1 TsaE [Patescibacteria group bacterium]